MNLIERIELARKGENPTVIKKLRSGWAVLGDWQFLRGYSLLLADPPVASLQDMLFFDRRNFLEDMALIGDIVYWATRADRINYEILGNSDNFLHAHVFPRYNTEPEEYRNRPVYFYPEDVLYSQPFEYEVHKELIEKMKKDLE